MGTQSLTLPVAGLVTDPGPFSAAPPGSLSLATNIAFRRPGVAEPRAKMVYTFDTELGDGSGTPCNGVVRHFDGSTNAVYSFYSVPFFGASVVRRDATTTITGAAFTSALVNTESSGGRLFATADEGVVTCDSNTDTTFRLAGMPQPMAPTILAAATTGWLANNYTTSYRVVFARNTSAGRLIVGPPSNVALYRNDTGGAVTPLFIVYLPSAGIEAGDELQVYRSYSVTPSTDDPADDMRLRAAVTIPASSISAGYIAVVDYFPDDAWSGPALYTNEAQEGALLANYAPGYARDVREFNNMMFYAGHQTPHEMASTVNAIGWAQSAFVSYKVAVASINVGNTVTLAAPLTAYGAQAIRAGQIITINTAPPGTASAYFSATAKVVSAAGSTITLDQPNLSAFGAANVTLWDWLEVDNGTDVYTIYPNAVTDAGTATGMEQYLSPAVAPFIFGVSDETGAPPPDKYMGGAQDMERAWMQAYPAAPYVLHAVPSGLPGLGSYIGVTVAIQGKDQTAPPFTVRSSNPNAFDKAFDPVTGVASALGGAPGRLAWSKIDVPDAVPLPYYQDVGDPTQPMLRVMPTQDALFIFKTDGVFRLYGQTPDLLTIEAVDQTARLSEVSPQWVTRFGDTVYALTSRGVCEFGNFGVRVIDQAIHQDIASVIGNGSSGVTRPFAMASSYNRFVLFGAEGMDANPSDERANSAFVYWPDLGLWSRWTFTKTTQAAGSGFSSDGLLGLPNGYANYVDEESEIRGSVVAPSYDLPQLSLTVEAVVGTTVTITAATNYEPSAGDLIVDADQQFYYVTAAASPTSFTLDRAPSFIAAASVTPLIAFPVEIEWIANGGGNPATEKSWQKFTWFLERLRGGTTITQTFQGYQNTTLTEAPVVYDPSLAAPSYATFAPFIHWDHVPEGLGRDWALKVGLKCTQAGLWFTTAGSSIEYDATSTRVGPAIIRNG